MIYIAGAIKNMPGGNRRAFQAMHEFLVAYRLVAATPYTINHRVPDAERTLARVFRNDLQFVCDASAIVVLPNSDASQGTLLECAVGRYLDIPIVYSDAYATINDCNALVVHNESGLVAAVQAAEQRAPRHEPLSAAHA